jgi:hypothetical protein
MSENLDIMIQKRESDFLLLISSMEQLQLQFIDDTSRFTAKWYEEMARQYITKFSDITLTLSKEQLIEMKTEVNSLVKNSKEIVQNTLSNPNIWWNQNPQPHTSFIEYEQLGNQKVGNKFPEIIDKPVRVALGELGKVLERFSYPITISPTVKSGYPEFWFFNPEDPETKSLPCYPHLIEWSEDMQETLRKYNELFKKAIILLNEILRIKDEKKQREVISLWESTP